MKKVTNQERYEDISRISGMSIDVVKRVLMAEKESILESLKRGENVSLIGRCSIKPELRQKLSVGGGFRSYVKASVELAPALKSELEKIEEFIEVEGDDDLEGIRLTEIML